MASKTGAKGQKIGRKRDRSPSHKKYNFSRKDLVNKLRKLKAHVATHPNDQRNASALVKITKGEDGPTVDFPVTKYHPDKHVPDGINVLELEFRKHHLIHGNDGKRKVVLEEAVCTKPIYHVIGYGSTVQLPTQVYSDAFRMFTESHGEVTLVERTGDKCIVLKNKKATPPKGFETQLRKQVVEQLGH